MITATLLLLGLLAQDTPREPGLTLRVYDVGEPMDRLLALVEGQTPNVSRVITVLDLSGEDFGVDDAFLATVSGWLRVETAGVHRFRLTSDDGSRLVLGGARVIDNDGLHAAQAGEGEVELAAGAHTLRVAFFESAGEQVLKLEWQPPGAEAFELVPKEALLCTAGEVHVTSPGTKNVVRPLRRSRPGDRAPLAGVHPSYDLSTIRPEGFEPRVGGIDWLSDGRMVLCTWDADGSVYLLEGTQSGDPDQVRVKRIAAGLAEPLGLCVENDEIYVLQKQELTHLVDEDGDDRIDRYRSLCSGWEVTANFHEFAFGLVHRDGWFYANLAVAIDPGGKSTQPQVKDRGHAIRISKDGAWESVAHGLRTPNGIGFGAGGDLFVTDNQGDWVPVSKLVRLEEGAFYGSRAVLGEAAAELAVTPPVVWLPQGEIGNSPSQPAPLDDGPYAGQMVHGDVTHGGLKRVFVEEVGGVLQGCVFRFVQGLEAGVNRVSRGPDGAFYVGGIGSTGNWGQAGKLHFGLQRLAYNGAITFEMLAVRAFTNGIEIELTEPLTPGQGWDPDDFFVSSWRYEATADYGGPKLDERELAVGSASVSEDRRRVFLELPGFDGLADGQVVYVRLLGDLEGETAGAPWSTEAWYTLNRVPEDRLHDVERDPPVAPPNTLTEAEEAAGWRLLFDGETSNGWHGHKSDSFPDGWAIEDGCLVHRSGGGDIVTEDQFESFELELEWKVSPAGNSGIFFHVADEGDTVWLTGPEMQVLDNRLHPDGRNPLTSAGANYALHPPPFDATRPVGRFNRARIVARGPHVEHWLNGHLQCEYELWSDDWNALVAASKFASMPAYGQHHRGRIALQDHGDVVWFRNIKIRDL